MSIRRCPSPVTRCRQRQGADIRLWVPASGKVIVDERTRGIVNSDEPTLCFQWQRRLLNNFGKRVAGFGVKGAGFVVPISLTIKLFLIPQSELQPDRGEERLEMIKQILLRDPDVEVEEVQELSLHQVDLCQPKSEPIASFHARVSCPVLVLGARVIQIFRGEDEGCKKDPVDGASHALGNRG